FHVWIGLLVALLTDGSPPETGNGTDVGQHGTRVHVLQFPPFDVAVAHTKVSSSRQGAVHMRRTVEGKAGDPGGTGRNIDVGISDFLRFTDISGRGNRCIREHYTVSGWNVGRDYFGIHVGRRQPVIGGATRKSVRITSSAITAAVITIGSSP